MFKYYMWFGHNDLNLFKTYIKHFPAAALIPFIVKGIAHGGSISILT